MFLFFFLDTRLKLYFIRLIHVQQFSHLFFSYFSYYSYLLLYSLSLEGWVPIYRTIFYILNICIIILYYWKKGKKIINKKLSRQILPSYPSISFLQSKHKCYLWSKYVSSLSPAISARETRALKFGASAPTIAILAIGRYTTEEPAKLSHLRLKVSSRW